MPFKNPEEKPSVHPDNEQHDRHIFSVMEACCVPGIVLRGRSFGHIGSDLNREGNCTTLFIFGNAKKSHTVFLICSLACQQIEKGTFCYWIIKAQVNSHSLHKDCWKSSKLHNKKLLKNLNGNYFLMLLIFLTEYLFFWMRNIQKPLLLLQANVIKTKVEVDHWWNTMTSLQLCVLAHVLILLRTRQIGSTLGLWISMLTLSRCPVSPLTQYLMLFFFPHRWIFQSRPEIWSCFWNTSPKQLRNSTAWPQREWGVLEYAHEKWTGITKITFLPLLWWLLLLCVWGLLYEAFVLQICHYSILIPLLDMLTA